MRWTTPLLLATSLHAAVIGSAIRWHQAGSAQPSGAPAAEVGEVRPAPAVWRLVAAPQRITAIGPAEPSPDATWSAPPPEQIPPAPPEALDTPAETASPPLAQALPSPEPTEPVPTPLHASASDDTDASTPAPEVYHPRSELSLAPRLQGIVDIAFPPEEPEHVRHEATLAVYIDEHGHVRKITTVQGELPPVFVQAARNAFLGARFQPGELHGQAVKSFIHVAVVFEAKPAELLAASRALPTH